MDKGLDHFSSLGPSIKLSLGPSLMASTLFHILGVSGIWGGSLLWQDDVLSSSEYNHMNPLAIELVYEKDKERRECKEKSPERSLNEKTCSDALDKDTSKNRVETFPQRNKMLESSFDQSTENYSAEPKDAIVITPSPGNQKPPYPLRAREENIEGTVLLRLTIGPSGQVLKATPLEPRTHLLLEKSTIDTVYHHTYIISGPPRTIIVERSFEFLLGS